MVDQTLMAAETLEIPMRVAHQRERHAGTYETSGRALRALDPAFLATLGRGSSAHAATWSKDVVELATGVPVLPLAMSTSSIYGRTLRLAGSGCIGISQSGRSADFLAAMRSAREGGATCFAVTNDPDAPVLEAGVGELPIGAGPERAVSATKSFTGSLVAMASVVAVWTDDAELAAALDRLAPELERALVQDWTPMFAPLKLKETCEIHAEPWSAAEVLHGPLQLAAGNLAAIVFASDDESRASVELAAERLDRAGATVIVADPLGRMLGTAGAPGELPVARTGHRWLDSVSQIASFYRAVETLARERGRDPDQPSQLAKVTQTR